MRRRSRRRAARGSPRSTCVAWSGVGSRRTSETSARSGPARYPGRCRSPRPWRSRGRRWCRGKGSSAGRRRQVGIWKRLGGFLQGRIRRKGDSSVRRGMVLHRAGRRPGDAVPRFQQENVRRNELRAGISGSPRPCALSPRGREARQRRHRLFGSVLLDEAEHRVQEDDGGDRGRCPRGRPAARNDGRRKRTAPSWRRTGRGKIGRGETGGPSEVRWGRSSRRRTRPRRRSARPVVGTKLPNDVRDLLRCQSPWCVYCTVCEGRARKQTMGNNGKGSRRSPFRGSVSPAPA